MDRPETADTADPVESLIADLGGPHSCVAALLDEVATLREELDRISGQRSRGYARLPPAG